MLSVLALLAGAAAQRAHNFGAGPAAAGLGAARFVAFGCDLVVSISICLMSRRAGLFFREH